MAAPSTQQRPALVAKELRIPFLLLLLCFAAWGTSANLTDVLVGVSRSIFTMTILESSLVQFAYYGAHFLLAIPAATINQRFGFKADLLTGLGLAQAFNPIGANPGVLMGAVLIREPSGYLATGTELVTGSPAPGVTSKNVEYGVRTCLGG